MMQSQSTATQKATLASIPEIMPQLHSYGQYVHLLNLVEEEIQICYVSSWIPNEITTSHDLCDQSAGFPINVAGRVIGRTLYLESTSTLIIDRSI